MEKEKSKISQLLKKVLNKEVIMYLIFGVLTTVVSLLVYYGCIYTFLNPENAVQLQIAKDRKSTRLNSSH